MAYETESNLREGRNIARYAGLAALVGVGSLVVLRELDRWRRRMIALEKLMPPLPVHYSAKQVIKPTPSELFVDKGSGTDFETRLASLDGYLTPTDRFYIRSHSPTPAIDLASWRITIEGSGVRTPVSFSHDEISAMPQVTIRRVIECAGNGRRFFKENFGVEAEGGQWRTGAIGAAEWTGVQLSYLLERAGLTGKARDVMPEGLDKNRVRRPMPLAKALADDTIVALKMNGEPLLPDHGFPARMVVSGWTGTASIKWVGRIEVAENELRSPWNTTEYVLVGPHYPMQGLALGPVITEMPIMSVIDLDWPVEMEAGKRIIRGRAFAGEGEVRSVSYRIDDGPWTEAELVPPNETGCWVRWQFEWDAEPGEHGIRICAMDQQGRVQPDSVPWNHHGYLYNAIVSHPVSVVARAGQSLQAAS